MVSSDVILIVMVLAGVATLQFYKGRRINLLLMQHYLKSIEDIVRPEDKNYIWLGGYVGFKAEYKVRRDNVEKFEYTLTLLPRQSLLYFPVSKLISRHDKLYIVVRPSFEITREIHLIQKGYYRIKPKIENEPLLVRDVIDVGGVQFEVLFEKRADIERLVEFVKGFSNVRNVKHVSLVPSTNVIYVFLKPEPETIKKDVKNVLSFVKMFPREMRR
ncbi:hypothetical protein [Pyrococcus yayanosii]|uniref:Uncharacterized protein n=1 Tax=Pyrococcus yayanosii (strain CH1 / JCM 16557) TaxID=529709 RepID=F8AHS1_PYRYC|nr:hypothetical protein [Pyrococcus yayanosii]AEH24204.1 hypothetical protein PYCH_05140 [Pyrococcus yayanosii CH1]